jgi:hypothetical protein
VPGARIAGASRVIGIDPIPPGRAEASSVGPEMMDMLNIHALDFGSTAKALRGKFLGNANPRDLPRLLTLWRAGKLDLEAWSPASDRFAEIHEAFDDVRTGTALRTALRLCPHSLEHQVVLGRDLDGALEALPRPPQRHRAGRSGRTCSASTHQPPQRWAAGHQARSPDHRHDDAPSRCTRRHHHDRSEPATWAPSGG